MIYPMFAMVLLTFVVGGITFVARVNSVKTGTVNVRYFKIMQSDDVPESLIQKSNNFTNLFQVPTLFYAAGCLIISLGMINELTVILSWLFVLSRVIHSYIHITYNHILHRIIAFMSGNLCLLILWIYILLYAPTIEVSRFTTT